MKSYKLYFGTIVIINEKIAEVIINEGVVMDEKIVDEYHEFLLKNLEAPFSLLINKKFAYAYTFEAQNIIANLNVIDRMAIVVYTGSGKMATKTLLSINEDKNWNVRLFSSREEALLWLQNKNSFSSLNEPFYL